MSRDFDPTPGQWYEDLDQEDVFKVVTVDPDEFQIRIQWLDGEYEDLDLDTWNELDLELAAEPEGWVDDDADLDDEDDEDDEEWDRALAKANGEHPIGVTQITEILNTPGVTLVAPLPREFELATVYTAAVCTRAAAPDAARRLVALLSAEGTRAAREKAGFER